MPIDISVTPEVATAKEGQLVVFTANVRNLTQQPLANVTIRQQSDAVLPVKFCTDLSSRQGSDYVWNLQSVPPGRILQIQVRCECQQAAAKACCRFAAVLADGRPARAETCIEITRASPLGGGTGPFSGGTGPNPPALPPSRLSVTVGNRNLVTAGGDQQFVVTVSNDGETAENDIVVTALLPQGTTLAQQGTFGPDQGITFQQQAGQIRFRPLTELAPKDKKTFRITVTTARPGQITLEADVSSRRQTQPIRRSSTVAVLAE
jgi:uncharacterized repeat protein (TIGR01451 family)